MNKKTTLTGIPRTIQVMLAVGGLLLLLPLLVCVAILIKISSSGPILFCQRRVGRNGREFTLYKLRTMSVKQSGPLVTAATDSRITPLGKWLRKSKIDELPELWNIVIGDMSFVGPRPEVCKLVNYDNPMWREVLQVRPGITDPVTLKFRNEEVLLAKVFDKEAYYMEVVQPYKLKGYVNFLRKKSWKTDVKIIAQTFKAIVLPRTAPPPTHEELKWSFIE